MLSYKKILAFLVAASFTMSASSQQEKKSLLIDLSYNVKNNEYPYFIVFTKTKVGKQFPAVPGREVSVYFNEETEEMLLGKIRTDSKGKALIVIGAKFKQAWDSASKFTFIATTPGDNIYDAGSAEINITKARIAIDTVEAAETRTLSASVMEMQNGQQVPANEVELKVVVKRMAGNLSVGDAETYTTDSTGIALAEFKKDSIPGDKEGCIIVIAKTEDNDSYGNISIEKKVKWGAPFIAVNDFDKRTLFATRDKSPGWLLILAYSIAIGVWGVIIYLVTRIYVMRRIGLR